MYGFRVILKNTFATEELDTVINQLVSCCQGDLQQFVDDRDLFIRVVGRNNDRIQPSATHTQTPQDLRTLSPDDNKEDNKWICIFWGQEPIGPPERPVKRS